MSETVITRLEKLKEKEALYRQKLERLRGQEDQLLAQLKNQFGISSLEEAKEKLALMEKDITKRESRLTSKLDKLEQVLN